MPELLLNLDLTPCDPPGKRAAGNRKHNRFVRRRRLLEHRGVLKQNQLPVPRPQGKRQHRTRGKRGKNLPEIDVCPEKPKPCPEATPPVPAAAVPAALRPPSRPKPAEPKPCPKATPSVPAAAVPAALRPPSRPKPVGSGGAKTASKGSVSPPPPSKFVAIDCEMVGTGPGGRTSDLARCSIVTYDGDVVYDRYVRPAAPIVDYRTRWSGIRRHHMLKAVPFAKARREIVGLLAGKVVVGHSIHNDFKALRYFHPSALTRDTSRIPLLNARAGFPPGVCIALRRLTKQLLHRDIQVGTSGHSSVEDAIATMDLYKVVEAEWEQQLLLAPQHSSQPPPKKK